MKILSDEYTVVDVDGVSECGGVVRETGKDGVATITHVKDREYKVTFDDGVSTIEHGRLVR